MNRIGAAESEVAERIQSIYDDFELGITPGHCDGAIAHRQPPVS